MIYVYKILKRMESIKAFGIADRTRLTVTTHGIEEPGAECIVIETINDDKFSRVVKAFIGDERVRIINFMSWRCPNPFYIVIALYVEPSPPPVRKKYLSCR